MTVGGAQAQIRRVSDPAEYPRLVDIWRSAVDATHDFLAAADRDEIESHLASDYFPEVELFAAERDGVGLGFAGVVGTSLEMLFVDAAALGQGVGSDLLAFVVAERGVETLDVNEGNAQALGFYRSRGFTVVGRSELDDQGRPYPTLHMRLGRVARRVSPDPASLVDRLTMGDGDEIPLEVDRSELGYSRPMPPFT